MNSRSNGICRLSFVEWPVGMAATNPPLDWQELIEEAPAALSRKRFEFDVFDQSGRDVPVSLLPDFAWAAPGMFAVSNRHRDLISWLEANGSLTAPIVAQNQSDYRMIIPSAVIDAFDKERSTFRRFSSSGRIKKVERWVISPVRDSAPPLFRVELEGEASTDLFATPEMQRRYLDSGATGLKFVELP